MLGKSRLSHLSQGTCRGVIASQPASTDKSRAKIYIFIFFLGSRKQNLTSSLSLCVYIFKILNKYQHLIVFIMQLTL